ncbi:MAG TPA: T9SS type A sorting domain-containing protein [Bacteroidales bacterium]|nr:T9SS type A sorting domain-containing protein [Bacteroidales bacterium]HPF02069.1 T9SS type A sorting domain-containing protein [Bacteroidales bacterium]HPR11444.1 T9SS type A sorting domain-containing protein [Bacteroidales bacterium]HRW86131.1 T9SS type A sorting domain-containing protein [Bacteroidales bacterium]
MTEGIVKKITLFLSFFFITFSLKAQDENFRLSVVNLQQTDLNRIEFDVYLLDTDAGTPFELASCQLGFIMNSSIYSGGTLSAAIDNAGSGLNSSQIFTASPSVASPVPGYSGVTLIRLAGRTPPQAGNGTIISTSGNGTLLTHFILTGSVSFISNTTPDLTFTSSSVLTPLYATRVNEYINGENTPLTVNPGVNAIVYGNPVLNAGVGIENNQATDPFRLFPMPFSSELNIESVSNAGIINYELINSAGKVTAQGTFSTAIILKTEQLPAGIYFLKLNNGISVTRHKVIKSQ